MKFSFHDLRLVTTRDVTLSSSFALSPARTASANLEGDFIQGGRPRLSKGNASNVDLAAHSRGAFRAITEVPWGWELEEAIVWFIGSQIVWGDAILVATAAALVGGVAFACACRSRLGRQGRGAAAATARCDARAMHADRLTSLGALSAGIVHEISNPLQHVVMSLDVLRTRLLREPLREASRSPGDVPITGIVEDALEGLEQIRRLVNDVRTFAHPAGRQVAPVDIGAAIAAALRLCRTALTAVHVEVKVDPSVPAVLADHVKLVQVFVNLFVNASQSMAGASAGPLRIDVTGRSPDGDLAIVTVEDSGPGMSDEALRQLFRPFFTTKRAGHGTGLGLYLCHSIVVGMGGTITAENRAEGGARFRIELPAARCAQGAKPTPLPGPANPSPPRRPHPRVLLVDDEPGLAGTLARALEDDFETAVATTRDAALELICGGRPFDVVVCDLHLPELPGPELFAEVRRRCPGRERTLLFMTGAPVSSEEILLADQLGAAVLEKPFPVQVLVDAVEQRADGAQQRPPYRD